MPDIKLSDSELLKYAVENGIIDAALLQDKIEMQKRKELLKKHPYSIWEGKNGYWNTYLPYGNGRKLIKKKKRIDIENEVIDYWSEKVLNSFKDRFIIWISRQEKCGRTDNTISKYESDYKRFFQGDKIESKIGRAHV